MCVGSSTRYADLTTPHTTRIVQRPVTGTTLVGGLFFFCPTLTAIPGIRRRPSVRSQDSKRRNNRAEQN